MTHPASTLLDVAGLSKSFGKLKIIDDVGFQLSSGECLALLGPSGCGKTTTLRCIAGLERVESGQISLGGRKLTDGARSVPPQQRQMGMVFQSYCIWPHLSVFENIAFGLRLRRIGASELATRVMRSLEMTEIGHLAKRRGWELSGGQLQRVALARTLVVEPRLVLFDEPLSNLDAKLRIVMREEIRGLIERLGMSAVYVTHDHLEASVVADRIAVMNKGRIEQIGTWHELYFQPATRFVGGFMSSDSMLTGTVIACTGRSVQVGLGPDLPSITVDASETAPREGEVVTMYIPREAVQLTDHVSNGLQARVVSVMPSPGFQEIIVAMPDGRRLAIIHASTEPAARQGDLCGLTFNPTFIRILDVNETGLVA